MTKLTQLAAWQALKQHYQAMTDLSMRDLFANDPARFTHFSFTFGDMLFDFSKNRITHETIELLSALAREVKLSEKIAALFSGQPINSTENRPALHTALRARHNEKLLIDGHNIMPEIHAVLAKMHEFSDQVRNGAWRGATGKPIRHIVNIGIGGSHLGPLMALKALSDYSLETLSCHFISNIDGSEINQVLSEIDPASSLFIISSKSFTTIETLSNAELIKTWLHEKLGDVDLSPHFVAVTASAARAKKFGIPESQIFSIWDWVGGRYSVWSAIGLPVAIMIGMDQFYEFLDGAAEIDQHFRDAEFSENIPVLLGLLGVWYINFFGANAHAIIPYAHELARFPNYIQQADMESNGKYVTRNAALTDYATGPIIFGEQGCDSQHSFFQLLHQGPRLVPIDFILVAKSPHFQQNQDILVASGLSQAQAFMRGKSYQEALDELQANGNSDLNAEPLARHKTIPGNRPSNTFFINKITPRLLGMLIAIYEHKIFVQGVLWDINSFDQWGVELGKQLLPEILADLKGSHQTTRHDSSTAGLIQFYLNSRNSL